MDKMPPVNKNRKPTAECSKDYKEKRGFDLPLWSAVVKIYSFTTLCLVNKDEDIVQQIFPAHWTIYF